MEERLILTVVFFREKMTFKLCLRRFSRILICVSWVPRTFYVKEMNEQVFKDVRGGEACICTMEVSIVQSWKKSSLNLKKQTTTITTKSVVVGK